MAAAQGAIEKQQPAIKNVDGRFLCLYVPGMTLQAMIRERGYRQKWIAERLDLSQSYFNAIALGKRPLPPSLLRSLAKILRATPEDVSRAATPEVVPPARERGDATRVARCGRHSVKR